MSRNPQFVVCESTAAITFHLREVTDGKPIRLGGHSRDVRALCGSIIAWDRLSPIQACTCKGCRTAMEAIHATRACVDINDEFVRELRWSNR